MQKEDIVYAFKTDTVWGFGANPESEIAISEIYQIKKRDKKKPLILMSDDFKYLEKYVQNVPQYAYKLIDKYLPGGLTLILEKSKYCSSLVTPYNTVGVRVPNSIDFFNLVRNVENRVLATTSCNVSGEEPVKTFSEAENKFKNYKNIKIFKPIDDTIKSNVPSTVILCEKDDYKILRQGEVVL